MKKIKFNTKAFSLLTTFILMSGIPKMDVQAQNEEIKISFAGDCTLGNDKKVNYFADMVEKQNEDFSYFMKNVKPIFENDDYTLVNLETTFTDAENYSEKEFNFKGDFNYVNILEEGSIEGVNIANNHTKDYLEKGYDDTIETLKNANIDYSGENNIHIEEIKGIKVGFIGFKKTNMSYDTIDKMLNEVKDEGAELIVASCHWGEEGEYQFNGNQQDIGRYLIDNGADIVIGHHPHVLQGIEEYNDKYIIYSLGNFCFGGNRNPKDKDTMIVQATFNYEENKKTTSNIEIIPCSISSDGSTNNFQPTILTGEQGEKIIEKVKKYSLNYN